MPVQAVETDLPLSVYKQEYDWIKLKSNEWLKGDIVSMYEDQLEFDSDELGLQLIDREDIAELRSKDELSIRMIDGTIATGYLVIKDDKLFIVNDGVVKPFVLSKLLSIASSGEREIDLWDAYLSLGANFRAGNTVQFDYTAGAKIQRRSSTSRFKTEYNANFSRFEDKETGISTTTANSSRLTSTYDWYFSRKIFLRAMDFEHFSDEFLNVDSRLSYAIGAGYHLIDNSRTRWDVNIGPSYQKTQFSDVPANEESSETSPGLVLGTEFSYEFTRDIDFETSYQIQLVNEASGEYLHRFESGLKLDLANDFDLNIDLYIDRTETPRPDENGNVPKKNDYRIVITLGYDF